jgi:hypothetical protein
MSVLLSKRRFYSTTQQLDKSTKLQSSIKYVHPSIIWQVNMRMVKTKIIATLGPGADSQIILRKMIMAGLDVVRLNFSHGTKQDHVHRIKLVRQLNTT